MNINKKNFTLKNFCVGPTVLAEVIIYQVIFPVLPVSCSQEKSVIIKIFMMAHVIDILHL